MSLQASLIAITLQRLIVTTRCPHQSIARFDRLLDRPKHLHHTPAVAPRTDLRVVTRQRERIYICGDEHGGWAVTQSLYQVLPTLQSSPSSIPELHQELPVLQKGRQTTLHDRSGLGAMDAFPDNRVQNCQSGSQACRVRRGINKLVEDIRHCFLAIYRIRVKVALQPFLVTAVASEGLSFVHQNHTGQIPSLAFPCTSYKSSRRPKQPPRAAMRRPLMDAWGSAALTTVRDIRQLKALVYKRSDGQEATWNLPLDSCAA